MKKRLRNKFKIKNAKLLCTEADMTDIVEGFRKVVQDLIVPEFKALQAEVKHNSEAILELKQEMKELRTEMNARFEAVNERFAALHKEMNERFEAVHRDIAELKVGQREILTKLDVDKRITKLETLMEQVLKKVA